MTPAARTLAPALTCAVLLAPVLVHSNTLVHSSSVARWRLTAAPDPLTLLVAAGPSDWHSLKWRTGRIPAHRFESAGVAPTATGWTRPLGLDIALRW